MHDAVLQSRRFGELVQFQGIGGGCRRGFFAIDVLAGGDGLFDGVHAAIGRLGVEIDDVVRIGQRLVKIGGPTSNAGMAASRSNLAGLRPTRIGSGMITSVSPIFKPPCWMMATMERMRCWFVPMRPVTPFMMMPILCMLMLMDSLDP